MQVELELTETRKGLGFQHGECAVLERQLFLMQLYQIGYWVPYPIPLLLVLVLDLSYSGEGEELSRDTLGSSPTCWLTFH